jgi:hypothetical protein
MECKARLRGLWRIIYSKTIIIIAADVLAQTNPACNPGSKTGLCMQATSRLQRWYYEKASVVAVTHALLSDEHEAL